MIILKEILETLVYVILTTVFAVGAVGIGVFVAGAIYHMDFMFLVDARLFVCIGCMVLAFNGMLYIMKLIERK